MNHDYEKLGAFYAGREYDLESRTRRDDLVLLDAKDFTTHAVIIGMTGSGKTGLGIGLLEEAAIDHIPVIAIDPKGDLGNIALTFPSLRSSDFAPWVDAQQASTAGQTPEAFADAMAARWSAGLQEWGQDGARVQRLRDAADVTLYTPGSTAGRPISLLKGFAAPPAVVRDDAEAFAERVDTTATGLLALLGVDADPISSREHILLANVFAHFWGNGVDLDLAALIGAIQNPPFSQIGVMPLDTVFPAKDRTALAMRLNNLLAAPGFQAWMQGDALDAGALLYAPSGKPRISVLSIAHLSDAERMFFVTMLLADLIAWMRQQPGTGSLRAVLYIDELFGYMPPVANPPSKQLLLTLLKQARAFGLGVVLSTQNPVDLDYKGLSNTGIWFIGRLQTEQDKNRVMDGLAGASGNAPFDRSAMERTISGLGKRVFLMHSVHENQPTVFETRWALSYLAGPMTREQIRRLGTSSVGQGNGIQEASVAASNSRASMAATSAGVASAAAATPSAVPTPVAQNSASATDGQPPVLPTDILQVWMPSRVSSSLITWRPALLGSADVSYHQTKLGLAEQRTLTRILPLNDDMLTLDWNDAELITFDLDLLSRDAASGAAYAAVPKLAASPKSYATWSRTLQKFISTNDVITLFQSKALKLVSAVGETEGAFRARLQLAAREASDARLEKVRQKYAARVQSAQEKVRRMEQAIEQRTTAASSSKLDTALVIGGAVLGALFSRKKLSATNVGKIGTAARSVGRSQKQSGDVARATENHEAALAELAALEARIASELELESAGYDAVAEQLEEIVVRPKSTDVHVQLVALTWVPYVAGEGGQLVRAT
jgi:hypothetical protein